jgi:hypothetical protein
MVLFESIDEGLFSLGESPKKAIYFHLKEKFGINKEDIPNRLEDFSYAMENIFGLGAKYLETLFMKNLQKKLNSMNAQGNSDLPTSIPIFNLFVKIKKQQFEEFEEKYNW